ncbi:hypothetical protein DMA12_08350 [Amycolatopsis balhimycina DSM 5908]|uniref:Uncharacterized protein n=1 Tax=Amycolatopsis balhimycina DSM 5908 TaxID=1081091 RepID=A0A428WX23_AMYBA|nr:hypothetical protein DMA12_08350 [Amycolatopsis balhimycina DSM 5908]
MIGVPEAVEAVVRVSEVLADADRAQVLGWSGDGDGVDPDFGELPLIVRLGHLGSTFARAAGGLDPEEWRAVLAAVEEVVAGGTPAAREAMTTGFLEEVQNARADNVDLAALGPRSWEFCLLMERRAGSEPQEWMLS